MDITVYLKRCLKDIPPQIGLRVNWIPYDYRPGLGLVYMKRRYEIRQFEKASPEQKQQFVFEKVKSLIDYSYINIPFYNEYYKSKDFNPRELKLFQDLMKIPIINKELLKEYNIERRSANRPGRYMVNTGGSSGAPFSLYIEPNSMGHEWAHIHTIWKKLGYRAYNLKLGFSGRGDLMNLIQYDGLRNTFNIDIYADYKLVAKELRRILKKFTIKYLHGYPASIYDFAVFCRDQDQELQELLSRNLIGAFLSSEYPHRYYRDIIENTFNVQTISWYGHTERCVLAYEKREKFLYEPFLTYGFAEALPTENGENSQLIATSYYNFASPLIRYNTEDLITDTNIDSGILNSFRIIKGRSGEFVIDKSGKKINLTGMIFGRHHELFNYSKFIQVKQVTNGEIEIHYVSDSIKAEIAFKFFDASNLNFDISFIQKSEPIRTTAGKVNLLIK